MKTSATALRASGLLPTLLFCTLPSLGQTATAGYPADDASLPAAAGDPAMANEDDESATPPARGAVYARLRHFEGGVSLKREDDSSSEEVKLDINSPLIPGDQVWTGEDGRMEIQLADGAILRLDQNSRLSILNLADRQAAFDNTTLVRVLSGSLYVRADGFNARDRRFQIDTPAGSIFLLSGGVFRVDVGPDGVSTVASYRGVAEVLSEDISVMAHSGERVTAEPGHRPGDARAFNTLRRDPFDVWTEERDDTMAANNSGRGARPEVPEPVGPYVTELSRYGAWRQDPSYGWVWAPDNVAADWRPYYYGEWNNAPIGLTWVSSEPWGWAPYHYGRWSWSLGIGWFWAPGAVYSGAHVSWAIGPTYFGWVPLGYYNTPVYYNNYYPWVYVPHTYIYNRNVCRHSYSYSDVARYRLGQNSVTYRDQLYARRGARPETWGATTYRKAIARQRVADVAPGGATGDRGKTPFKVDDQRSYRRALMSRSATLEQPKAIGRASVTRGAATGGSARAVPVSYRQKQGTDRAQDRFQGGARLEARNRKDDFVSPVTGRPGRPPVRMVPEAGQPAQNASARGPMSGGRDGGYGSVTPRTTTPRSGDRSDGTRRNDGNRRSDGDRKRDMVSSVTDRPGRPPVRMLPESAQPSQNSNAGGQAPRGRAGLKGWETPRTSAPRSSNRSSDTPAIPHPRAGGGASGGGPRPFVMPMRPSNQGGGPAKAPTAHSAGSPHASSPGHASSPSHAVSQGQKGKGGGGKRK